MTEHEKIHILVQELIPVFDDLESDAKRIVQEHMKTCQACRRLSEQAEDWANDQASLQTEDTAEVKPLRRLIAMNKSIKLFLIAVRAFIFIYVVGRSLLLIYRGEDLLKGMEMIKSGLFIFYMPASIFLLAFTSVFLNSRWLKVSFFADVMILFVFGYLLNLFS